MECESGGPFFYQEMASDSLSEPPQFAAAPLQWPRFGKDPKIDTQIQTLGSVQEEPAP